MDYQSNYFQNQHSIQDINHYIRCEPCLMEHLPNAIEPDHCLLCGIFQSCPKAINYCQDCSQHYNLNASFKCELCDTNHLIRWIKCKVNGCSNYVNRNNIDPTYYSVFCDAHKGNCLYCLAFITNDQITCSLFHSYHRKCFIKCPESIKSCKNCVDLYDYHIANFTSSKTGEYCSFCNLYMSDSIATCLQSIFICREQCPQIDRFMNVSIDCNCVRCNIYKDLQQELKLWLATCSQCHNFTKIAHKSVCGNYKYCQDCCNKKMATIYLCNCNICIDGKVYLRSCGICGVTKLEVNIKECSSKNYYCKDCTQSWEKIQKIPMICICEICIGIYLKFFTGPKKTIPCFYCKKDFRPMKKPDSSDSFVACLNCRRNGMPHVVGCTCEGCQRYSLIKVTQKCKNHPNRPSQVVTSCRKNFCFECIFQENAHKFPGFLYWYSQGNFECMNKPFSFKCPDLGCEFTFNLPVSLVLEKLKIFTEMSKPIIELFTPYFEGIKFNFYKCNCEKICAVFNDCVIGCTCPGYVEEIPMGY